MCKMSMVCSVLVVFGLSAGCGPSPSVGLGTKKLLTTDLGAGATMDFVLIHPGSFLMGDAAGDDDEKPVHKVTITNPFYIGKYEVTQEQWQAVMGNNPSKFKGAKLPVDSVNWLDCQEFIDKLNAKVASSGTEFALPTEAQWEYACRAGSTTRYYFGNEESSLVDYGWFDENAVKTTHPVGEKQPNAWGLFDMHGNVLEWCSDDYNGVAYKRRTGTTTDPVEIPRVWKGGTRVMRGGAWDHSSWASRATFRVRCFCDVRHSPCGFRVVCVGMRTP